jgi:hypothetical protein
VPILLALLLAGGTGAWGNNGGKRSPAPGASVSPTPPKFNVPIPVGHGAVGVKLPYFDQRGKLQMFFNIAKAYRADLKHLQMENAFMQTYDENQAPDANVYMTFSVLDLDTRIVTSDVPVTVRHSDFEIVGQKMVFNTQTRVGRMSGHVHMLIFNSQAMAAPKPSPGSSPATSPSAKPRPSATP